MPWCQGAENSGLFIHKLKPALKNHNARPSQTNRQTDRRISWQ